MVTNLDDAVEITPKLVDLFQLIRDENSLQESADIIKVGKGRLLRILTEERDQYVHEPQVQNAIDYFKGNGVDEGGLCKLLGVDDLEETFFFVRVSERDDLVEKANQYITSQEISRTEFINQLVEDNPEISHMNISTLHDFFLGKPKVANLKILKALKLFIKDKDLKSTKEQVDYDGVMKMAHAYIKSEGITKNELAKKLREFDSSIGGLSTINDWLNRKQKPNHLDKLRIMKKYIEINKNSKKPKPKTGQKKDISAKYARSLFYICLDGKAEIGLEFPAGKTCPTHYINQLEEKIIETYSGQKYKELPSQVLLNLFATSLCSSTLELHRRFPKLSSYLTHGYEKDMEEIFAATLSSMPDDDLLLVADNFEIDVSDINPIIQRRDGMEYTVQKRNIEFKKYIKTTYEKLVSQVEMARERIKNQIMKKIF